MKKEGEAESVDVIEDEGHKIAMAKLWQCYSYAILKLTSGLMYSARKSPSFSI